MTRLDILFGLVSLLPAAVNTTPGHSAQTLLASLCTGDGVTRTLQIPLGRTGLPGGDQPGCCAKGCHSGATRKRSSRKTVDPSQ